MDKVLKGQYLVEEKLGEGAFSQTFRAKDLTTHRPVVVKMYRRTDLADGGLNRILSKLKTFQKLTHPTYAVLADGDYGWQGFYFVREYIDGESMQQKIIRGGHFSEPEILSWASNLAEGLQLAHDHGVIHAALSARNIYFTPDKKLKLVDFAIDPALRSHTAYRVRFIQEDPYYLSPEELLGLDATPATDIYRLAILVFRLWTGRYPFQEGAPLPTSLKILRQAPPHPRDFNGTIPPAAEQMLLRALSKEPASRFDRIQDFIESVQSGIPPRSRYQVQIPAETEHVFRDLLRHAEGTENSKRTEKAETKPSSMVRIDWRRVLWAILSAGVAALAGFLFYRFVLG